MVKKYGWRALIRALEQSAMSAISEPVRPIQLSEIQEARKRIANIIVRAPLIRLELGAEVPGIQLKLEPALTQIFSRRYLCELNCACARRRLSAATFNPGLRRSAASNSAMLSRGFPDASRARPRLLWASALLGFNRSAS